MIVIAMVVPAFLGAAAWGGEPLSKKAFLKQGNAICADANEQVSTLAEETFAPYEGAEPPVEAVEAFGAGLAAIIGQSIVDIEALQPPKKDAKKVQKILDAYTDAVDKLEADPSLLLDESGDVFTKANKLAGKYGLKQCAEGD